MKKINTFDKIACITTIALTAYVYSMLINSVGEITCQEPELFGWGEVLTVTLIMLAGFNVVHQLVVLYQWIKAE